MQVFYRSFEFFRRQVAVSLRHPDSAVPHKLRHGVQVCRGFHQSAGEGVPQAVKADLVAFIRDALVKEFIDHILEGPRR